MRTGLVLLLSSPLTSSWRVVDVSGELLAAAIGNNVAETTVPVKAMVRAPSLVALASFRLCETAVAGTNALTVSPCAELAVGSTIGLAQLTVSEEYALLSSSSNCSGPANQMQLRLADSLRFEHVEGETGGVMQDGFQVPASRLNVKYEGRSIEHERALALGRRGECGRCVDQQVTATWCPPSAPPRRAFHACAYRHVPTSRGRIQTLHDGRGRLALHSDRMAHAEHREPVGRAGQMGASSVSLRRRRDALRRMCRRAASRRLPEARGPPGQVAALTETRE